MDPNDVLRAFVGSDGELTKRVTAHLRTLGEPGQLASWLFTIQKSSSRAKVYRRRRHKGASYGRKDWAICQLTALLAAWPDAPTWGWGIDELTFGYPHVLYIDLPTGQVSFHTSTRHDGPAYPGTWDGQADASAQRIITYAANLVAAGIGGLETAQSVNP